MTDGGTAGMTDNQNPMDMLANSADPDEMLQLSCSLVPKDCFHLSMSKQCRT